MFLDFGVSVCSDFVFWGFWIFVFFEFGIFSFFEFGSLIFLEFLD